MRVTALDHLVLTVADVERSVAFYRDVLGMSRHEFGAGRVALRFGALQINLHPAAGEPILPRATAPTPGSGDLCFLVTGDPDAIVAHLRVHGVEPESGVVPREGAAGRLRSVYLRDPDGNLIELSVAGDATPG